MVWSHGMVPWYGHMVLPNGMVSMVKWYGESYHDMGVMVGEMVG
jgi:hypothetical protein